MSHWNYLVAHYQSTQQLKRMTANRGIDTCKFLDAPLLSCCMHNERNLIGGTNFAWDYEMMFDVYSRGMHTSLRWPRVASDIAY